MPVEQSTGRAVTRPGIDGLIVRFGGVTCRIKLEAPQTHTLRGLTFCIATLGLIVAATPVSANLFCVNSG